jgi:hypothetical protein
VQVVTSDDVTIIVSNVSTGHTTSYKSCAPEYILHKHEFAGAAFCFNTKNAIADSGATHFFVMEGTPIVNRHTTMHPLKVVLADGRMVMSTHMCDIHIKGLPTVLTGHIIVHCLSVSIHVLTDAGCTVTFDKECCTVRYNGNIILSGKKDPSTYLWTLQLGSNQGKTSHHVDHVIFLATPVYADAHANMMTQIAFFMHTVHNKANIIYFAHQSLCSPKISTLLKVVRCRYLKGCPMKYALVGEQIGCWNIN